MADGILQHLHRDHEEALRLIEAIGKAEDHPARDDLFKQMMEKLLAHSHAEQTVFYKKLEKSGDYRARGFAYQGENEHQHLEYQLQWMLRASNKASEQWNAQLAVLRDLVARHVGEEESRAFPLARRHFDADTLESIGREFMKQKESQLSSA
jgi:hemerythrin-like domain-containing protein